MTLMSTLFIRVVRAEISGLRGEIGGLRAEIGGVRTGLGAEIDALRTEMLLRFELMEAKFDKRFDHLDRDVQAIAKVVFPEN